MLTRIESKIIFGSNSAREPVSPPVVDDETGSQAQCRVLEFTEIYTYYEATQSEQFIELYNPSASTVRGVVFPLELV